MMNKPDLNEIPERFHILFDSDWNNGNTSTMSIEDRIHCQNLYLEYNKWQIKKAIKNSTPTQEELNIGFIKD